MPVTFMRQFFDGEVTSEQLWQLFDWCLAHGATAFSVGFLSWDGRSSSGHADDPSPLRDEVEARLRPFALQLADPPTRWRLTPETVACIRTLFPEGILGSRDVEEGWAVDLRLFRGTEGMFWAVTHEGYGFVRLTGDEHADVEALGIRTHPV